MVSVCLPSDASLNTYHLIWVSLTLDGGREEQPHVQGVAAARAQEGQEELRHVQDQEG